MRLELNFPSLCTLCRLILYTPSGVSVLKFVPPPQPGQVHNDNLNFSPLAPSFPSTEQVTGRKEH